MSIIYPYNTKFTVTSSGKVAPKHMIFLKKSGRILCDENENRTL